jgi:hypothetical protein
MQIPFNVFYEGRLSKHSEKGELRKRINSAKFLLNEMFSKLFINLQKEYEYNDTKIT